MTQKQTIVALITSIFIKIQNLMAYWVIPRMLTLNVNQHNSTLTARKDK